MYVWNITKFNKFIYYNLHMLSNVNTKELKRAKYEMDMLSGGGVVSKAGLGQI